MTKKYFWVLAAGWHWAEDRWGFAVKYVWKIFGEIRLRTILRSIFEFWLLAWSWGFLRIRGALVVPRPCKLARKSSLSLSNIVKYCNWLVHPSWPWKTIWGKAVGGVVRGHLCIVHLTNLINRSSQLRNAAKFKICLNSYFFIGRPVLCVWYIWQPSIS